MSDFWSKKRVLVTGGHGFVGTHLVKKLNRLGANVIVPTQADYDLVDGNQVKSMFKENPCDMVIHLAAVVGGIGANRKHPGKYFYDNAMMGIQMIEQARQFKTPKFVAIGTICAYPKYTPIPFKEEDLWDGYPEETNAPYGLAKKMMLVQSQGYREEYGFNSIFLLPVNQYGPGDNFHPTDAHVIPDLIRKCVDAVDNGHDEIVLWGDGSPTREFLYVEDTVQAIVLAAEKYNKSDPVNLGSGSEISIKDLVELVAKETGYKGKLKWDTTRPNGQPRRKLDTSRAKKEFGFESTTTFNDGLRQTIAWYRELKK